MMPVMNGIMLAVSGSLAASIVAKATVTAALGLIGAWLARRSRAAVRHALLAAAFGVMLMLPFASVVAPPVRIALPAVAQERVVPGSAVATRAIPVVARAHPGVGAVPESAGVSTSALLLAGWLAGTALFLLPVVIGLWQIRWLRRSALPWLQGRSVVDKLALDAGIHRRVEVLLHGALPGPMTCGVVHPAILLPQDAQTWDGEDLNRAVVHELEHVRRGDWVSQFLARAVCAVYWFHPLVWMAWRRLALEAERSCDDAVLRGSEATAYADQLVGLAQRLSSSGKTAGAKSPLLAMANRADLAARVGAVLDSRQRRGRAGTVPVALACAAAAVLVLTVSPLRMVASPQTARTEAKDAPMPRFSANTMLVISNVIASDRNGLPIEGLNASDFVVTEEGAPQTISVFEFQGLAAMAQTTQDSISSYYIVGYYTANQKADGGFRTIKIASTKNTVAKLDYRSGYYTRSSDVTALVGTGESGVNRITGLDVAPPVLLYKKESEYSEEARKAKYQGTVGLHVEVNDSGQATNIQVIRSLGLGLDEKAIEAVRQWKFKPGMKYGQPLTMQVQVDVNFRLL
jgi:TonB family protein